MATFITANVGRHGKSRRAIRRVLMLANIKMAVWVCWQEIDASDTPNEHGIMDRLFKGWSKTFFPRRTPILYRALGWKHLKPYITPGHPAIAHICPNQGIFVGLFQRGRKALAVLNGQVVADAYSGRANPSSVPVRRQHYKEFFNHLWAETARLNALGYDAIVCLDKNTSPGLFRTHAMLPEHAVIVAERGNDAIVALPAPGHYVKSGRMSATDLGVDYHHALRVKVQFKKEKK